MEKLKLLESRKSTVKETTLHRYFKEIKDIYPYAMREEKKRLWNLVVERITVYDDYIDVFWRGGIRTRHGKKAPSSTQNGGGIEALHLKKIPQGSELCMVREGGVLHFTHSIFEGLEKEFN